jgi:uroporphyrinogen-III decarboxylase
MAQLIYGQGLLLPDVTGPDWYDSDKVTQAVLSSIKSIDYDVAIPTYYDRGLGVPPLGGAISIPEKFGFAVGPTDWPVNSKADWPKVQKKLSHYNVRKTDPRMKGALEVIKNVSTEVGEEMPLVVVYTVATSVAMSHFRGNQAFLIDMTEDPEWVDEMCRVATDWTLDWIRAQYEAGANSVTIAGDGIGAALASPMMAERYNLPSLCRIVEMVRKEFNQGVWYHLHGDFSKPRAYEYLTKLANEVGIEGFHFDESNRPGWIKHKVVEKLGKPACIIIDGATIEKGPVEKIQEVVKNEILRIGDGIGIMMAPSCQLLPGTENQNFKAWVDATHEYGKYPLR